MAQNTQQRALLKNRLQTPLIIRDLLVTATAPSAETTYALHEILSDLCAEDAILSSAFILQEITALEGIAASDLDFLHLECDRLIECYAARDDLANDNPALWEQTKREKISNIAEDIEGLIDLLSLCILSFEITAPQIAEILGILEIQMQAHLIIIDQIQELLESPEQAQIPYTYTNNVIAFPAQPQKRIMRQA